MGIITELQNEAARVARRADQQVVLGNRRIVGQNAKVDTIKGEMAPLQEIINHYNTVTLPQYNAQAAAYNASAQQVYREPIVNKFQTTPGYYETRYNQSLRPAALDSSAATAANASLTARTADIDALNASGKSIERRNGLMAQRAERESERLNTSIEMNQRAINEERQPQQQASAFDETQVFQSISDWLK